MEVFGCSGGYLEGTVKRRGLTNWDYEIGHDIGTGTGLANGYCTSLGLLILAYMGSHLHGRC